MRDEYFKQYKSVFHESTEKIEKKADEQIDPKSRLSTSSLQR